MNSSQSLLWGIAAIVGLTLWSKARAAATLIFLPGGISQIGFDNSTPVVDLTLVIQNTSSSGFTLESLAGNLYCDNTYIGNISSFVPVRVDGNTETVVPVKARLMLIGLVNQIIQAVATKNFTKKIEVRGFANAGFVRAPVNVEFTVGA